MPGLSKPSMLVGLNSSESLSIPVIVQSQVPSHWQSRDSLLISLARKHKTQAHLRLAVKLYTVQIITANVSNQSPKTSFLPSCNSLQPRQLCHCLLPMLHSRLSKCMACKLCLHTVLSIQPRRMICHRHCIGPLTTCISHPVTHLSINR